MILDGPFDAKSLVCKHVWVLVRWSMCTIFLAHPNQKMCTIYLAHPTNKIAICILCRLSNPNQKIICVPIQSSRLLIGLFESKKYQSAIFDKVRSLGSSPSPTVPPTHSPSGSARDFQKATYLGGVSNSVNMPLCAPLEAGWSLSCHPESSLLAGF